MAKEEVEMQNALYNYVQHTIIVEAQHTGITKRSLILVLLLKLKIFLIAQ